MRIISAEVENFASYEHLKFDFNNQGLALIAGATGSGKSTLCDIVPWILFGTTAKNGAVDEIRSWNNEGPTTGVLTVDINNKQYVIVRTRGPNDLYYQDHIDEPSERKRGKDLNDTQKLINNLLGIDAETYLSGAYFHEFSKTAQFFTTTAKIRRQITEQMVDLKLAKTLTENMSLYKKELKEELVSTKANLSQKKGHLGYLEVNASGAGYNKEEWDTQHTSKIARIEKYFQNFENEKKTKIENAQANYDAEKEHLESLLAQYKSNPAINYTSRINELKNVLATMQGAKCDHCGAPTDHDKRMMYTKEIHKLEQLNTQETIKMTQHINLEQKLAILPRGPLRKNIIEAEALENTYGMQLEELRKQENPYFMQLFSLNKDIKANKELITNIQTILDDINNELSDIELLLEVIESFRGHIVKNAVLQLETNTNDLLTKHFDAEIRVVFDANNAENIDLSILKDGNDCVYTQLSKGQRQLLKLCFGVSVMKAVSNYQGIDFNCIWIDEALDGLSEELKIKAFSLLQTLATSHESVFVVDHSEAFKSLFDKRFEVILEDGNSRIEEC